MKAIPKTNPKCPVCKSEAKKIGLRKSKRRTTQRYLCKNEGCKKSFSIQPTQQANKTYSLKTILNAISNYNLGVPLRRLTCQNNRTPKPTIHNWLKTVKLSINL